MILLYFCFLIVGFYLLKKQNRKLGFTGGYSGFVFGMLLYYAIIPIIINIFEQSITTHTGWEFIQINRFIYRHGFNSWNALFSIFITTVGLTFFNLGYNTSIKQIKTKKNNTYAISSLCDIENQILLRIVSKASAVTFIIGSICFYVFTTAIGGIERMLSLGDMLRQHDTALLDYVVNPIARLMIVPTALLPVSTILFLYLILNRKKWLDKFLFCISLCLSTVYLIYNAGRSPIIRFLIVFLYMIISKKRKRVWTIILIISVFALPLLDFLDSIFIYFATNIWEFKEINFLLYLRQFSQPTQLQFNLAELVDIYGYRFFKDFLTDVLSFAPGVYFEMSFENTSEFMKGTNWRSVGGTPNDVLTYGYIQLGISGVIIILFFWGLVMGFIDRMLMKTPKSRSRDLLTVVTAVHVFAIVSAADLYPIVKYNPILPVLFLIYISYSRRLKKIKKRTIINEIETTY